MKQILSTMQQMEGSGTQGRRDCPVLNSATVLKCVQIYKTFRVHIVFDHEFQYGFSVIKACADFQCQMEYINYIF